MISLNILSRKEMLEYYKDHTDQYKQIHIKSQYVMDHDDFIGQHLYITSDEEIKEGDWRYNKKLKSTLKK